MAPGIRAASTLLLGSFEGEEVDVTYVRGLNVVLLQLKYTTIDLITFRGSLKLN